MNERIEELLMEAHRQTKGGIYSGHPSEWSEKFAKLIVGKCILISRTSTDGFSAGRRMAEHFGVEE